MSIKIDKDLLRELGLDGLPEPEVTLFLRHTYETLEMRVGHELASRMSNEQLDQFGTYFQSKDDKAALAWLESNFPDYKEVVRGAMEKLKLEISQLAPAILSLSRTQSAQPAASGAELRRGAGRIAQGLKLDS